jgi:hypothetical protein
MLSAGRSRSILLMKVTPMMRSVTTAPLAPPVISQPVAKCTAGPVLCRYAKTLAKPLAPALLVALSLSTGCYDGEALINDVRSAALRTRLVEIDLGSYRTTMPRTRNESEATEIELHIFGTVPRYRVPAIEKVLAADGYRLRHETIAAVRKATAAELAEPDLAALRARLEKVINARLADASVKSIGFYEVRVRTR